jgi:hypothetical protein
MSCAEGIPLGFDLCRWQTLRRCYVVPVRDNAEGNPLGIDLRRHLPVKQQSPAHGVVRAVPTTSRAEGDPRRCHTYAEGYSTPRVPLGVAPLCRRELYADGVYVAVGTV